MSWPKIAEYFNELSTACDDADPIGQKWSAFQSVVAEAATTTPYHLKTLLRLLNDLSQEKPKEEIAILDHGCGGGLTLLFLAASGYRNIYGVDVNGAAVRWNYLAKSELKLEGQRFWGYNGETLPFSADSFDIIFSQQVLEHVSPQLLVPYYREEYRVLRQDGIAYHQVPHRLVPFESHSRTWFLHYLPHSLFIAALSLMNRATKTERTQLFLRWPWAHRRQMKGLFGNVSDITLERLMQPVNEAYYDGPVRLRRLITAVLKLPVIGSAASVVLRNLVQIDTVSVKR